MSFSESIEIANSFILDINNNKLLEKLRYKIYEIIDNDIDLNNVSNCNLRDFSYYNHENEILFFPFSCFEVINYEEKKKNYFPD